MLKDVAEEMPGARWKALLRLLESRKRYSTLYRLTIPPSEGTLAESCLEVAPQYKLLTPQQHWDCILMEATELSTDNVR